MSTLNRDSETPAAEPRPGAPPAPAPARTRPLWALALMALGGLILALNLGLLPAGLARAAAVAWPVGVMAAGLAWVVLGERLWQAELAPVRVARGEAREADLVLNAGTADVRLESGSEAGALAAGELPRWLRPQVSQDGPHTTVRLETLWGLPALGGGRWRAALAGEMPWRLEVATSTGRLELDLTSLAVRAAQVQSTFGDADLSLPVAGGAELDIRLTFGDLTIRVPEGLGVKVRLQAGALAEVTRDERRFIELAPQEFGTPLYAVAARRCTLTVWLGTGRLEMK